MCHLDNQYKKINRYLIGELFRVIALRAAKRPGYFSSCLVKLTNQTLDKKQSSLGFSMGTIMCNHRTFALFDLILGAKRSDGKSNFSAMLLTKGYSLES